MPQVTSISFAPDHVPQVLNGTKILTYRIGDKFDFLRIGDTIDVIDSSTQKVFGRVKITEKSHTTFKDLPINRSGNEVYASKEDQRKTFEKYYGKVEDDEKILVLGYKLLKS